MPPAKKPDEQSPASNFSIGQILPHFQNNKEEDIEFFISQFEELANLEDWTEVYKNVILKSRIRGKALERLNLTNSFRKSNTLADTIKILTHNFKKTKSQDEIQAEFNNLKHAPQVSIKELALDIEAKATNYMAADAYTAESLKLVDKIKLNKFIEIVREDIRFEIKKVHPQPKTFQDAVNLAKTIENALKEKPIEINHLSSAHQITMPSASNFNLEAIEARQTAQEFQLNEILTQLKTLTVNSVQTHNTPSDQRPVFRQQQQLQNPQQQYRQPFQRQQIQQASQIQRPHCVCCGKYGHFMSTCFYNPANNQNAASHQNVYSLPMPQPFYPPPANSRGQSNSWNRFPPPNNGTPRFPPYDPNFRPPFRTNTPGNLN